MVFLSYLKEPVSTPPECKQLVGLWNGISSPEDTIIQCGNFFPPNDNWRNCLNVIPYIKCKVVLIVGDSELSLIGKLFYNNVNMFSTFCLMHGFYDIIILDNTG